ncbi:DUF2953 domain-containing protein [Oceanobacillus luteolus]|nr:DUF2953 domain-containing protein [Oceanobacillus luteolus]
MLENQILCIHTRIGRNADRTQGKGLRDMIWSVIFCLIVCLLVLLFILLRFQVHINYRINFTDTHRIKITVLLFKVRWWSHTFYLPILTDFLEDEDAAFPSKSPVAWRESLPLLRKIKVENLKWETGIGIGEAHFTGILTGFIWAGKEMAVHALTNYFKAVQHPVMKVQPNYHGEGFYSKFDCKLILSFRTYRKLKLELQKLN